jgi:DNA polymerase-3 subunit delta
VKLRPEELPEHLTRELLPVYLVAGDEPLQRREASDAIQAHARAAGYDERELLEVERGFDWSALRAAASTLSLFASRRLIELRLKASGPGREGAEALKDYLAEPPADTLLLIKAGKLDASARKSAWFRRIDQVGAIVQVWPARLEELPRWIEQRLAAIGLTIESEAAILLGERVEGNLLAAAQEIEKLRLLHRQGRIGLADVAAAVGDSARYDVFDLSDALLAGDAPRTVRILQALRAEDVESVLVVWLIGRELRLLYGVARAQAAGRRSDEVMEKARIWSSKRDLYRRAARRFNPIALAQLLSRCAYCDRLAKGQETGDLWTELIELAVQLAGHGPLVPLRRSPGRANQIPSAT